MSESLALTLRDCTTLRLGGRADDSLEATTDQQLVHAVASCDEAQVPVLILGGGSNLVVSDAGVAGRVVKVATRGIEVASDLCGGAFVSVAAGEPWDGLVSRAVNEGWVGIEALSGIPGLVGATPIQNVGAYGQEVADTIARVRTYDRYERAIRTFAAADCDFGYRSSRFKAEADRYVILEVTFQFRLGGLGVPVAYAELARSLGVDQGQRAPAAEVRAQVLSLRSAKGMVLDADDHDTWSAGSFFTNPVLNAEAVPPGAPAWPQGDGSVKTSAAWLIDHAGFAKGHPGPGGRVSLSTKHPLALTNRGSASTDDLLTLAREVRDGVEAAFGVRLEAEPVLVGCQLR